MFCNYSDSKHLANFLIVLSKAFDLKPSREAAVGFECPENLVAHAGWNMGIRICA